MRCDFGWVYVGFADFELVVVLGVGFVVAGFCGV